MSWGVAAGAGGGGRRVMSRGGVRSRVGGRGAHVGRGWREMGCESHSHLARALRAGSWDGYSIVHRHRAGPAYQCRICVSPGVGGARATATCSRVPSSSRYRVDADLSIYCTWCHAWTLVPRAKNCCGYTVPRY